MTAVRVIDAERGFRRFDAVSRAPASISSQLALLQEKARFRDLEHEYAASHIARLQDNTANSIETSSLHIDLISDLKRINSHICSIAYPILESAGALTKTRIRHSQIAELGPSELTPQELGARSIRDSLEAGRA